MFAFAYLFQPVVKRLYHFKVSFFFFYVLNNILQGLLSLYFWKKQEMLSAYSSSHSGSAAADWEKGMKSHRMGLLNVHDILHGTPWLLACSGFTGPSRCYWPPLQGGTSAAFLCQKTQLPAQENQGRVCATGLPHRHEQNTTRLE